MTELELRQRNPMISHYQLSIKQPKSYTVRAYKSKHGEEIKELAQEHEFYLSARKYWEELKAQNSNLTVYIESNY